RNSGCGEEDGIPQAFSKSGIRREPGEIRQSNGLAMKRISGFHAVKTERKSSERRIGHDGADQKHGWKQPEESSRSFRRTPHSALPSSARVSIAAFRRASSGVTAPAKAALSHRCKISDACAYCGMRGLDLATRTIDSNCGEIRLLRAGIRPAL